MLQKLFVIIGFDENRITYLQYFGFRIPIDSGGKNVIRINLVKGERISYFTWKEIPRNIHESLENHT